MSDREFENYLTLIGRLLRLSTAQRGAIGAELRDHFESRLTELTSRGIAHDAAVKIALEEFGDAAGLASQFTRIAQTRKRRLIMRCTLASAAALAGTLVVAISLWPENHAAPVLNQAVGQTAAAEKQTPEGLERLRYTLQNVDASSIANSISKFFGSQPNVTVIAEQNSNSVLVSAPADSLKEISKLLVDLDRESSAVAIEVWFVDLQPNGLRGSDGNRSTPAEFLPSGKRSVVLEKLHQLERDGKAVVANHFQLTTLDNQMAYAMQGDRRPRSATLAATAATSTTTQTSMPVPSATVQNIGAIVRVQPRVNSRNEVTMQVSADKSLVSPDGKGGVAAQESKGKERDPVAGEINTPIVGQSIIRVASGNIVSLSGVTSETTGCYQILVSAEVLPQDAAAK
jgi:type II secretory pathway component GspD/PulD (secretin)